MTSDIADAPTTAAAAPASDWRERLNHVLIASVAAALLTLAATMIRMNERDLTLTLSPVDTFMRALSIYVLPTTVLAVVLIVAGMLGAFRNWFFAGVAGFVGGIIGGTIGYLQQVLSADLELSGEAWAAIFLEFFGNNFPFLAFATIISGIVLPLIVRRMERDDAADSARSAGGLNDPRRFANADEKLAFVRVPANNLDDAELTHLEREEVDADLAADQWEGYVEVLEAHGWETIEVPAAETLADSVYTDDMVVLLDGVAILTRPASSSRRAELPGVRAAVEQAGFIVETIEKPATLDGGDVVVAGDTLFVGASGRTNAAGIRALREIATGLGYRVVAVPVRDALHLGSVASALPDGTIVTWLDSIDQPELLGRIIAAPEREGASVLALDGETLLVSSAAPKTAGLLTRLGYRVLEADITEFEKLEGGVTGLSARAIG